MCVIKEVIPLLIANQDSLSLFLLSKANFLNKRSQFIIILIRAEDNYIQTHTWAKILEGTWLWFLDTKTTNHFSRHIIFFTHPYNILFVYA